MESGFLIDYSTRIETLSWIQSRIHQNLRILRIRESNPQTLIQNLH